MATTLAYDAFNTGTTLDLDHWQYVVDNSAITYDINANLRAEPDMYQNQTASAFYTGHADGRNYSAFVADCEVEITRPYQPDTGTPHSGSSWLFGIHFGWINTDRFGPIALNAPTTSAGYTLYYDTTTEGLRVAQTNADASVIFASNLYTGGVNSAVGNTGELWEPNTTHKLTTKIINTAITNQYDDYYQTATQGQPQGLVCQCFFDDIPVIGFGIGTVQSLIGTISYKAEPNGGTVGGLYVKSIGNVDYPAGRPEFDNFRKSTIATQIEPEPSCDPEPTLSSVVIPNEITAATNVLTAEAYFPDAIYRDSIDWYSQEQEFENGYKLSFPKHTLSRRTIGVTWGNRSTTDKDLLNSATGSTHTVLQWTPPDEAGTLYWYIDNGSLSVNMVAPEVFTIQGTLIEARI